MVRILVTALAFFHQFAMAAIVPSGVPAIGLGAIGATTIAPSNIPISNPAGAAGTYAVFSLFGGSDAALTSGRFYPLYKDGDAYQVTSGKTAVCFNFRGSGGTGNNLGYQIVSDSVAISFNQSSALTSGKFQGGASSQYVLITGALSAIKSSEPGIFKTAATRYMGFQVGSSQVYQVSMDCYEY